MAAKTRTIVRYRSRPAARRFARSKKATLPLAVVGGFAPLGFYMADAGRRAMSGDLRGAAIKVVLHTTGYNLDNRKFWGAAFWNTYGPIMLGMVVHKAASRLGINRQLAKAGEPFVRI